MRSRLVREGCEAGRSSQGRKEEQTRPWRSQSYWRTGEDKITAGEFAFMTQGTSKRCQEVPGTAQVSAGKHQSCGAQQWGFFLF